MSFAFWLFIATSVSRIPTAIAFRQAGEIRVLWGFDSSINGTTAASTPANGTEFSSSTSPSKQLSLDAWFSLSLPVAVDALAVVFTFNRALIRGFHYAVSQRMMFLASALSYAVLLWNKDKATIVSRHPVGSLVMGFALYMLLDYALNAFERTTPSTNRQSRWGTLQQYSQEVNLTETSWRRALFLTIMVGGVGVVLTMLVAPPWSGLVPIAHILFEVCSGWSTRP